MAHYNEFQDFNNSREIPNPFGGSAPKTAIIYKYDNNRYMLKRSKGKRSGNVEIPNNNSVFSEHVGSVIFKLCGFDVHKTYIGEFKGDLVVGCKDFTQFGTKLHEFSKLVLADTKVMSVDTIEEVKNVIDRSPLLKKKGKTEAFNKFWDVFVVDALINNPDRNNNNWGFIEKFGNLEFSTVYDNGSALGARICDEEIKLLLENPQIFKNTEVNNALAYYRCGGRRIQFREFLKNPPAEFEKEINDAVKRIVPKVSQNLKKIVELIETCPYMSTARKDFTRKAISMRYNEILLPAYDRVYEAERAAKGLPPAPKKLIDVYIHEVPDQYKSAEQIKLDKEFFARANMDPRRIRVEDVPESVIRKPASPFTEVKKTETETKTSKKGAFPPKPSGR